MTSATPPDKIEIRQTLRHAIEEAIEKWRDEDVTAEPGILRMYEPDDVKMLARAIRDAIQEKPTLAADARWQALRSEIQQDRAAYDKQAASHTLAGRLYLQGRCQGRVAQCEGLLAKMTELEARDV